ncbi:MAG: asparagine synthetase B, partial [Anaerolineae bacterium]|nr:asparagine synthetase B [Anaerolineae bacterium]
MSGYAGVIHLDGAPPDPALIELLSEKLAHRGRDGQGIQIGETWAMAHCLNRLTKTLQSDAQPLTWGDLTLVSDARIDGRHALIDQLRSMREDAADDASDAALILHAFRAFGERCVEYLIGDYTFALWNSAERTLFAARDPLGKRSLYYALTRDAFIFSNELRPIRHFPRLSQDLDPLYIADFLALGDGFWLDRTITPFAAIRRLDRGHALILRDGTMSIRQFWSIPEGLPPLRAQSDAEVIEQFNAVFREAVRDRLTADRVVLTLSGGMDSSTVTAVAVDILRKGESRAEFTAITSVYTAIDDPELLYGVQNAQALGIQERHVLHRMDHYALLHPYYHIANAIRQHLTPGESLRFKEALASLGKTAFIAHLGDELGGGGPLASYLPQMRLSRLLSSGVELWRYFGKRPPLGLWSQVGRRLLNNEPPARGSEGREFPPGI